MSTPTRAESEKPERSRNAKAQARHRAKRKAYIEELEETVTKLQSALGQFNLEHTMTVLPPPLAKIRELEQENARLQKQNDELHRLLSERRPPGAFEHLENGQQRRNCDEPPDREYGNGNNKRRKMGDGDDNVYISRPGSSHAHPHDGIMPRPPPLTVPDAPLSQPLSGAPGPSPYHDSVPTHHTSTAASYPHHGHPHPHTQHTLDGPALHLPDPRDDANGLPPHPHPDPHGGHYTLPPFKFAPLPEHDSWRPYAESERGP
ncbi:hypothetical protein K438DRAFT_1932179 [Mycena galopus ATCC 62051]|nr:hypothetical protein K438DRAFT_1932179 [Mycena galopus ATCC 62051]